RGEFPKRRDGDGDAGRRREGDAPSRRNGFLLLLRGLDRELQARGRYLDVRALGLTLQVDDDALAAAQRRAARALARGAFRARGGVHAVQIVDALQVVHVAARLGLRDADLGHRETLDLDVIRLAHVADLAPAPVPADAGRDRAFGQADRGIRS